MEKIASNMLSEYLSGLEDLRARLAKGEEVNLTDDQFKHVCQIYFHYQTRLFKDLNKLQKKAIALFLKHEKLFTRLIKAGKLTPDAFSGVLKYTYGCLHGTYDGSGFDFTGGNSLELCAYIKLKDLVTVIQKEFPQAARVFEEYGRILKSIEGAYHTVYWILRHTANQHLDHLKSILFSADPVFQSFILHAMDEFIGNEKIINLYQEFIATFEKIKTKSNHNAVKNKCNDLIIEAKDCLGKVSK